MMKVDIQSYFVHLEFNIRLGKVFYWRNVVFNYKVKNCKSQSGINLDISQAEIYLIYNRYTLREWPFFQDIPLDVKMVELLMRFSSLFILCCQL